MFAERKAVSITRNTIAIGHNSTRGVRQRVDASRMVSTAEISIVPVTETP